MAVGRVPGILALPGLGRSRGANAQHQAKPSGPRYASYLQMVGVKPMDLDAANAGARRDGDSWVLGDVDLERARELAAHPKELDVLAHADHKWIPTQTWKLRHGGATPFAEAKEACAIRHFREMADELRSQNEKNEDVASPDDVQVQPQGAMALPLSQPEAIVDQLSSITGWEPR